MTARKARCKDARPRGDDIGSPTCECEFEQAVQPNSARDREEHEPGDAGLVIQEEISGDSSCRDEHDYDAAQTGYIARCFPYPGWPDRAGWVVRVPQRESDPAIKRRRIAPGDLARNQAK